MSREPPPEVGYTPQPLLARTRKAIAARGLRPVAGDLARWGTRVVTGLPWTVSGARGAFELGGERYPYLFHRYKMTWVTERAVEVPVVQRIVDRHAGRRVLEVGNVLSHYRAQDHLVVDKYEQAAGVLNRDVLELGDLGEFDLIVAISTLEHVGWDEHPQDPDKASHAVSALRGLLSPGGQLVVTVPLGYNPSFDASIRDGRVPVSKSLALRRTTLGPHWRPATPAAAWSAPYDFLLYSARAVLFAFVPSSSS